MNKKGMEEEVLVTTIVIIVSFIVLAFVAGRIAGIIPGTISKETCHSSVLLRGLELKNLPVGKSLADLKCKTEYKCISMGGTCPKGYDVLKVSNEEDIKRELANSMYDCWWQLGEGKVDVFYPSFTTYKYATTCSICSIISFDDKLQKAYPSISGLGDWMTKNNVPGAGRTYWQYLTNSPAVVNYSVFSNEQYATNRQYAVTFAFSKAGQISKVIEAVPSCAIGAAATVKALGVPTGAILGAISGPVGAGMGIAIEGVGGCIGGVFGASKLDDYVKSLSILGGSTQEYYSSIFFSAYDAASFSSCQSIESIP